MMGAHAAAHAAAVANAIKASGVVVKLEPTEWLGLLKRIETPLIVVAPAGVFKKKYRYLTSYRGLAFATTSDQALMLPGRVEIVTAKSISLPEG